MGKGSRNRQRHQQDRVENPKKYRAKRKKSAPRWLAPAISLAVVVAIVIGAVVGIVAGNGGFKRGRVLVESKYDYDINQQMATYMAWQSMYSDLANYWTYAQYGVYTGDQATEAKTFSSADAYALALTRANIQNKLRDSVDAVVDQMRSYVALCDKAHEEGIKLDAADQESIDAMFKQLESLKNTTASLTSKPTGSTTATRLFDDYTSLSMKTFYEDFMVSGMKEKDIRNALEVMVLANKYATICQSRIEEGLVTDNTGILANYRDSHLEDFYTAKYLTYAADAEEFANKLKECTEPEDFQKLVLETHFDENYKAVYNKYTTQVKAEADFNSINGKIDQTGENASTAWSDAKNAITGWETTTHFAKDDTTLPAEVMAWMFSTGESGDAAKARKRYESTLITTDDAIWLVTLASAPTTENTEMDAFVKKYELVSGETHQEGDAEADADFKQNIRDHLIFNYDDTKAEDAKFEISYLSAKDRADELQDKLDAQGADKGALMTAANATAVNADTDKKTLPKAVTDAVAEKHAEGAVLVTNDEDTGIYYVIHVTKLAGSTVAEYSYVAFESDLHYKILDDITASLDKVYPTEKSVSYDADAAADSFEAWISAKGEGVAFTRVANETFVASKTADNKTTYNAYIVISPMAYDTEKVVHGGYVLVDANDVSSTEGASDYAQLANELVADLSGKNFALLTTALSNAGGTTSTQAGITVESLEKADAKLKDWFLSADRQSGQIEVIDNTAGDGKYVVGYVETLEAWASKAKISYVSEEISADLREWMAGYTVKEKNLKKLGDPTPIEAETTTAAN